MLSDVTIIESSAFVAAPLAGLICAQMGATVIRIDPPRGGLDANRWPVSDGGVSLRWAGLNKGKLSMALDLSKAEGQDILHALLASSGRGGGIFLTNFRAAGALSYAALQATRDDVIQAVIKGNRDGSSEVDYTVNPALGFAMAAGFGDRPVNHVLPAWDIATGLWMVSAITAAVRERERTGQGRLIEMALSDAALAITSHLGFYAEAALNRRPMGSVGNDLYGAFGTDFPTRDGHRIMLAAITIHQWKAMVKALEIAPAIAQIEQRLDLDFDKEGDRYHGRAEIAALVAPWMAARSYAEAAETLDRHDCSWGPYRNFRETLADDPRCSLRNPIFESVKHPGTSPYLTAGLPYDMTPGERQFPGVAPVLGQHTAEILERQLKLKPNAIARLFDSGVVAGPRELVA